MLTDIEFLIEENAKKPVDPPPRLISEWVNGRRVMPPNTPFPGFWENRRTPYLIEIMDNMSPFSPTVTTSVMKGAQIGVTAGAENVMGYWMDPNPAEILYCTATDDLLEIWATKRLEPLIDSIGMRHKICVQADVGAKSRRTGDKTYSKEYSGGTLNMASAQSASSLRSDSKRILVLDEIDGAPAMLRTGEGTWIDVAYARTNAWGVRKKILEFSTPTTYDNSLINKRYEDGDRRRYKIPCLRCGTMQFLETEHLRHKMKHGQLHSVWYECPHCNKPIYNHEKNIFLAPENGACWEPTAVSSEKNHRSYQISSLYSPVGMLSWFEYYQKYLNSQNDPEKKRSFRNLYEGMPYRETGSRPKLEKVIELRGEYREGEVPEGVLYITAGVDVQRGSEGDPNNKPRLEMEILGHGAGYRTWSIAYKIFEGETTRSPYEGAWEAMHKWASEGGLVFKNARGRKFVTNLIFIDSGDGPYVDIVYAFASRWDNTFPSKGFSVLQKRKLEKGDETGPHNFIRYRAAKSARSGDATFYEISTNHYKTRLYNNLTIARKEGALEQRPGFCDFPRDRGEEYFKGLVAAEKRSDGSFHSSGRREEPLDCRVYALCAGDVFLDARVSALRVAAKANGASDLELQQINHVFVLNLLARSVSVQ